MGQFIRFILCAVLGAAAGLAIFASLMLVTVEGSLMLPELEPGDRVLVQLDSAVTGSPQLEVGDLVLWEAPYYTASGEGLLKIRRITGLRGDWVRLDCDLQTVGESQVLVRRREILGEVLVKLP